MEWVYAGQIGLVKSCPNCHSTETIDVEFFGEEDYQKIRKERGFEGVVHFWFSSQAVHTPPELAEPLGP